MNRHILKITLLFLTAALVIATMPLQAAPKGDPIVVNSAEPNEAEQGQELDVTIRGSGFGKDAKVKYLVTNTDDDTQIDVLSTQFIDESTLKTRIRVKDTAAVTDYDIVVQRGRRKGKGTTRFAVQPFQTPNDGLVSIFSDGAVMLDEICTEPVNPSTTSIICNGNDGNEVQITLGQLFYDYLGYDKNADGMNCFGEGPTFTGTVQLRDDFGNVGDDAVFRFEALNDDGTVLIQYVLTISDPHLGWSDPPGFPPGLGETTTLMGTHWALSAFKRDKKHGPCTGSGDLSDDHMVTVDLTRVF